MFYKKNTKKLKIGQHDARKYPKVNSRVPEGKAVLVILVELDVLLLSDSNIIWYGPQYINTINTNKTLRPLNE
jgi:hypothetical protein